LEIEKLLHAIYEYSPGYLYPNIRFTAETAAKVSEVIDLRWDDLNPQDGTVKFKQREKIQSRKLNISDELAHILNKKKRRSKLVFLTYYNDPFTRTKLTRAVNEFKQQNALSLSWDPSDLRHSFAVNFLLKGGDIRELQRILGHNNVFDTKRLYGEVASNTATENLINLFE